METAIWLSSLHGEKTNREKLFEKGEKKEVNEENGKGRKLKEEEEEWYEGRKSQNGRWEGRCVLTNCIRNEEPLPLALPVICSLIRIRDTSMIYSKKRGRMGREGRREEEEKGELNEMRGRDDWIEMKNREERKALMHEFWRVWDYEERDDEGVKERKKWRKIANGRLMDTVSIQIDWKSS